MIKSFHVFFCVIVLFQFALGIPVDVDQDCTFKKQYPKQYIAKKVQPGDINIDGKLDDKAWQNVPWTENFVDIMTSTKPRQDTRVKLRWDDDFLYIGAMVEETQIWANISSTCHCLNPSQDQIIYHDNDFEVFVDPLGSNHYYKEFEINALAATWDLCLNKPYVDHGYENSTRVFGTHGYDMVPQQKAKTFVSGTINNPSKQSHYWTAEIALPFSRLIENNTASIPPKRGDFWRINFSRVEWNVQVVNNEYVKVPSCQSCQKPGSPVEDNWVWQEMGAVNMHLPNRWGMLLFDDNNNSDDLDMALFNPEWPVRYLAMAIYDAQQAYHAKNGFYAGILDNLKPFVNPPDMFDQGHQCYSQIQIQANGDHFQVQLTDITYGVTASIQEDRLLTVNHR